MPLELASVAVSVVLLVALLVAVTRSSGAEPMHGQAVPTSGPAASVPGPTASVRAGALAPRVDAHWVALTATRTGIPERALTAYAAADLVMGATSPGCRVHWPTLAGIGAVESAHGAAGGGLLGSGAPTRPIIGVPLDGRPGVATVHDSDGGRLDGDRVNDRAVGPMQFVPSTWEAWHSDGDGDGVADPQDIDDAALAAARYLCSVGGDLAGVPGWTRAVLGYNASMDYVRAVNRAAVGYAGASRG